MNVIGKKTSEWRFLTPSLNRFCLRAVQCLLVNIFKKNPSLQQWTEIQISYVKRRNKPESEITFFPQLPDTVAGKYLLLSLTRKMYF